MPSFNDLIYYKNEYDRLLEKSYIKKSKEIERMKEEAKENFVRACRLYYNNKDMQYKDLVKRFIEDLRINNKRNNKLKK